MTALSLYQAGQLGAAIEALAMELRRQPADTQRRTFLFELLCFAGEYDRAAKHLDVLASGGQDAGSGAMLYRAALHAQQTREGMFERGELPQQPEAGSHAGVVNGEAFESFSDEDERFGAVLEVFIAGSYTLVPFRYIESLKVQAPQRLRDLLWAPALLRTTSDFRLQDLGEVLLPVLAPLTWKHPDEAVRLGRTTVWVEDGRYGVVPAGQKTFVAGERDWGLLELRELSFSKASTREQGAEPAPEAGA